MNRDLGALVCGFALGVLVALCATHTAPPASTLDLSACLAACAPDGLAVFEADRACYCDIP